ncbi:MAG: RnfABCDGE type electron transport complex subunit D [Treponema sp.]|nr:RnfABCDGE type electron transport complex subunit D [Treponema sp.]
MSGQYTVSFAPHLYDKSSTRGIMADVVIALLPSLAAAILVFGWRAALLTGVCVLSCLVFEGLFQIIVKKPVTVFDFSAVITGMLLAFNLPVGLPLWQAIFGCFVAIVLVKQLFGGLGKNFANPALTARIVLFLTFTASMTVWVPVQDVIVSTGASPQVTDTLTSATPLRIMHNGDMHLLPSLWEMFIGLRGGCLGETSALALLLGGLYLIVRRVITWHIPVSFMASVLIFSFLFGVDPLYHLLAGGLFLGAIFMATDYVTSPQTARGRLIFGASCGIITMIIRVFGNYPEGVSFAILFMNMLVPYINRLTIPRALGVMKP